MREVIEKILAKSELVDADLETLVENQKFLTEEEKVKLGFSKPSVKKEPVVEEKNLFFARAKNIPETPAPKKRGRPAKK